jgi:hypothetical protein
MPHRRFNCAALSPDFRSIACFSLLILICIAVCIVSLMNPNDIFRSRQQFKYWYKQYQYQFSTIARENCTEEYSIYLYGTRHNTSDETISGAGKFTLFVQPMIYCLLNGAGNYVQYQLNSAQVVLGITPTIIALLGNRSEELCLMTLIGRRWFLGLLLSFGSPSIYSERAFMMQDPNVIMDDLTKTHATTTVIREPRPLWVAIEYAAAIAAIANIATLNWQLGIKSINTVNPNTIYMPMIWSFIGVIAHLGGAVVFNMRVRGVNTDRKSPRPRSVPFFMAGMRWPTIRAVKKMVHRDFTWPSTRWDWPSDGDEANIMFTNARETQPLTLLAWMFSMLTIFHIILGTLIFAGTNFVGPKDAFAVMARYILSVVICRIIVVYELSVLKLKFKKEEAGGVGAVQNLGIKGIEQP